MPESPQEKKTSRPSVPEPREEGRAAGFTDGAYIPRDEAPNMPRVFSYDDPREEREKKGHRLSGGTAVLLCLICLLLGAGLHAAATRPAPAASADDPASTELPPEVTAAPTAAPEPTEVPVLAPGEIYTIACAQVVGVTTEAADSNVFDMPAERAVSGTGCILTADGYILTNYHVIEEAVLSGSDVKVMLYSGEEFRAEVVGYEKDESDIAVLKIDAAGLRPIVAGDTEEMRVGDTVYAVGNPLGELTYTMTPGMISALDREITTETTLSGGAAAVNMFQLSAPMNRGNSGGPVYNDRGEVIGIVTAKYSAAGVEGLGFAIPINDAVPIAQDIMENGYVRGKPYLGVIVQTVTSAVADYYNQYYEDCMVVGAQIYAMDDAGAAAAAGLLRGDIITALDGRVIASAADLTAAEKDYRAGDKAVLTVYRAREYLELSVEFAERLPESPSTADSPGNLSAYTD